MMPPYKEFSRIWLAIFLKLTPHIDGMRCLVKFVKTCIRIILCIGKGIGREEVFVKFLA